MGTSYKPQRLSMTPQANSGMLYRSSFNGQLFELQSEWAESEQSPWGARKQSFLGAVSSPLGWQRPSTASSSVMHWQLADQLMWWAACANPTIGYLGLPPWNKGSPETGDLGCFEFAWIVKSGHSGMDEESHSHWVSKICLFGRNAKGKKKFINKLKCYKMWCVFSGHSQAKFIDLSG